MPARKTLWFPIKALEKAAMEAEKYGKNTNTFFGVGLRKNVLTNNLRGGENDISAITTLFADIDIKGNAHSQKDLPNSRDEAIEFLNFLVLKPSIVVSSGNGLHVYWLLDKPFKIQNSEDKKYISEIFRGFSKYTNSKALNCGWKLDNISDLARILRVPGTFNHKLKSGAMCKVIQNNNLRYGLNQFAKFTEDKSHEESFEKITSNEIQPDALRIIENCNFIRYCKENAKNLPEPYWHAMITNLAPIRDGAKFIHEFSRPYLKYNESETDKKIKRAINENKPHTCQYIKEQLGFECLQNCNVKAPIVHGTPSKEQSFMELLQKDDLNPDEIFSRENISLCSFAKVNMPSEYAKFKSRIRGKVNLRDFEKAVQHENKKSDTSDKFENDVPLDFEGINLNGAVVPAGWNVTISHGIQKSTQYKGTKTIITVCSSPVVITKRLENIDDGTEKIELSFFRDGRWKKIIAARSGVFNRNSIIKYADSGLPISSSNATDFISYLSDYENTNIEKIPLVKSIVRLGWIKHDAAFNSHTNLNENNKTYLPANKPHDNKLDFFPCSTEKEIVFESESSEVNGIVEGTKPHGDFETWKTYALKARKNPFARFLISASFSSPLLLLLDSRVFFIHIWYDSQSGKTAAIKFGISIWGDPNKLMGSFNATSVGLERMAGILKHLPFAIDELQVLNDHKLSVEKIVYSLGNGFGRVRGNRTGGMQYIPSWQNIMITSGEQPINNDSSNDGAITRVLELYGRPVDDVQFAHDLHVVSKDHYGLAGKKFIEFLIKNIDSKTSKQDYKRIVESLSNKCNFEVPKAQLDNVSLVCLGDYYSSMCVFEECEQTAWNEVMGLGVTILNNNKQLQKEDTINRAWEFVLEWISSNKGRFSKDSVPCYGEIDENIVYIIPHNLKKALNDNFFDYSKATRGFKDRGYLITKKESNGSIRMQIQKRINGINQRCFCILLDENNVDKSVPLTGKKMGL